jgi:DNA-binding IscR family transcriptional regulator
MHLHDRFGVHVMIYLKSNPYIHMSKHLANRFNVSPLDSVCVVK